MTAVEGNEAKSYKRIKPLEHDDKIQDEEGHSMSVKSSTTIHNPSTSGVIQRKGTTRFAESFAGLRDTEYYTETIPASNNDASGIELHAQQHQLPLENVNIRAKSNAIIVNPRQRGNPILKHITNVPIEYGDVVPDYVMGTTTCALFLSLRYHSLNPNYIHGRLQQLGKQYELRILLIQVDVKDPSHILKQMTKIAILTDCTLLLAWSPEEAGRYLETYKSFENKPPDLIMKKQDGDNYSKIIDALTSVRNINRSDATMLLTNFVTLESIIKASKEDLSFCPGIGPHKASRLYDVLHSPFLKTPASAVKKD